MPNASWCKFLWLICYGLNAGEVMKVMAKIIISIKSIAKFQQSKFY